MIYETADYLHESMYDYKRCKEMENYIEQTMEMSRKFLSVLLKQTAPKLSSGHGKKRFYFHLHAYICIYFIGN